MKILKLLNKKYLSIFFYFLFFQSTELFSNEPVDIWNLENKENLEEKSLEKNNQELDSSTNSIYEIQPEQSSVFSVEQDEILFSNKIQITGIYDPSDNDLTIDMWVNSDGKKIIELFEKIKKIDLSIDSKEILKILLLTNSYSPSKNISYDDFLKLKHDWLLQNADLNLIEQYLIKNKKINNNNKLIKFFAYLLNQHFLHLLINLM